MNAAGEAQARRARRRVIAETADEKTFNLAPTCMEAA
jgi:hypothetical protein